MRREEEIDLVRKAKEGDTAAFAEIDPPVSEPRIRHGAPDSERPGPGGGRRSGGVCSRVPVPARPSDGELLPSLAAEDRKEPRSGVVQGTAPFRGARGGGSPPIPPGGCRTGGREGTARNRRVRGGGEADRILAVRYAPVSRAALPHRRSLDEGRRPVPRHHRGSVEETASRREEEAPGADRQDGGEEFSGVPAPAGLRKAVHLRMPTFASSKKRKGRKEVT